MQLKSVLLVANGDIFSNTLLESLYNECDSSVAVDGGARHLFDIDKIPNFVIGDMDSEVHRGHNNNSIKEISIVTQSETDLVKTLKWCTTQNFTSIELIGVEGGRSDHILGIYAAIVEANIDIQIRIHLKDFVVHILGKGNKNLFKVPKGKIISTFALMSCTGLSISGTKWELDNVDLDFATTGIHNESIGKQIDVEISNGKLALFIQR